MLPALLAATVLAQAPVSFDDASPPDRYGFTPARAGDAPLRGADFYRAVDRPDLAASYTRRDTLRWTLFSAGVVTVLGGLRLVGASRIENLYCDRSETHSPCVTKWSTEFALGWAVTAVGVGALIMPLLLDPNPVDPFEARRLADAHNRAVRWGVALSPTGGAVSVGSAF